MSNTLTLIQPDDFHAHFRQGDMLKIVVPYAAKQFARAIAMPNTVPPVTTVEQAQEYYNEIKAALPEGSSFEPLMTLYFTENLDEVEIKKAKESGIVHAIKLYPKGATTNSDSGVDNVEAMFPILELLEKYDLPLLIHGEVVEKEVDIFYRERVFVDTVLTKIIAVFPNLRIVMEHVTSAYAAEFILEQSEKVAATVTVQHLYINRNDILVGGIKPHYYCLPIAKKEDDRLTLRKIVTSGSSKFFAGTDSAPHAKKAKESACGCAGLFTHYSAVELYAQVFDEEGELENLEAFLSKNGADFYGLPYNKQIITLEKKEQEVPESIGSGDNLIVPFKAGETIGWSIK